MDDEVERVELMVSLGRKSPSKLLLEVILSDLTTYFI